MKMLTASAKALRTCRAPCQSISSMMSKPLARASSIHLREVP